MNSEIKKPKRGRKATTIEAITLPVVASEKTNEQMRYAEELGNGALLVLRYEDVMRQLGQLEALEFTRRVADVSIAQIFEQIRKSKSYIGLPYIDEHGKHATVATIEEFCEVKLGKSYRRCLDLSQNIRTLGPELYEQSERLGLRSLDYRAINALPADDLALVTRAIESRDIDVIKDVLQEFAAKKQLDDEAHKRELDKAREEAAAKDQVLIQKSNLITELVADKNRSAGLTEAERLAELEKELVSATLSALGSILLLRNRIGDIRKLDRLPQGLYTACSGTIQRVASELMSIATDYGFEIELASEHMWEEGDPRKTADDWLAERLNFPASTV